MKTIFQQRSCPLIGNITTHPNLKTAVLKWFKYERPDFNALSLRKMGHAFKGVVGISAVWSSWVSFGCYSFLPRTKGKWVGRLIMCCAGERQKNQGELVCERMHKQGNGTGGFVLAASMDSMGWMASSSVVRKYELRHHGFSACEQEQISTPRFPFDGVTARMWLSCLSDQSVQFSNYS